MRGRPVPGVDASDDSSLLGSRYGNGRRHVIEQGRKQAHKATFAESLVIQCSTDFKNTGNSGNGGNSHVLRGFQRWQLLPAAKPLATAMSKAWGREALL